MVFYGLFTHEQQPLSSDETDVEMNGIHVNLKGENEML